MPGEDEHVARDGFQNIGVDCLNRITCPVEVGVDAATHDGNGRYTGFFERYVIAAGKKPKHVDFVREMNLVRNVFGDLLLKAGHADGKPSISYSRVIDVDHAYRFRQRHDWL